MRDVNRDIIKFQKLHLVINNNQTVLNIVRNLAKHSNISYDVFYDLLSTLVKAAQIGPKE